MLKFTIVTPTCLRPTLVRTCRSIEEGSYTNWEHIIVVDDERKRVGMDINHAKRNVFFMGRKYRMHGSPARAYAYRYITGDYVMYLDDDDYWINDTLAVLAKAIEDAGRPDWGVFPARRWDGRFFNPKPGDCATMSCQFFHKPVIKGVEIRWIPYNISSPDGKLVQGLTYLSEPLMVDGPELVVQESQLFGRRPEDDPATYKKW